MTTGKPLFESIKVSDAPAPLVCGPLTRTHFVRYAGASHDFNPNHHDEVYAQANGNKAVFGMGMLAGGYCARLLTDWLGQDSLLRLRIRFASRFWPGDVLTCMGWVSAKREVGGKGLIDCEFSAVNQAGEVIIRGDATAVLPRGSSSFTPDLPFPSLPG
ncbi:MAG TPA: MaoC/PaaZ C-terminal domain-containing protein [Xanthobacteraceae bacterium]|nr:MaoC/PaaZ C-terminal domain-containing protein [Xanthobacteraceae bacterium]